MFNVVSLIIGLVALLFAVVAFLPLVGWAYWVIVPVALVGLAFGAMSDRKAGRNLNLIVVVVGIVRLLMGGGVV